MSKIFANAALQTAFKMEEKRYTKLGIFIFLFFVIMLLVFSASIINLISGLFQKINQKNQEFKCSDLKYVIKKDSIIYKSNNLIFEVFSQSYDYNITDFKIRSDLSTEAQNFSFDPVLKGGDAKFVQVSNISVDKGFYFTIDNCIQNFRFVEIR